MRHASGFTCLGMSTIGFGMLMFLFISSQESAIELVVIDEDGWIRSICEQPVFGIIKDLKALNWREEVMFCYSILNLKMP